MRTLINFLFGGKKQSQLNEIGRLLLRLLFGVSLAINHGYPTFRAALDGVTEFQDPNGLGSQLSMFLVGSAEFVLFNLTVAFFIFHSGDAFGDKELAYLYLSAMSTILLLGPGKYSLDAILLKPEI